MRSIQRCCSALVCAVLVTGCSVPIAANLGERDANQAMVALESAGVFATKAPDPTAEGRWRLSVPRGDAVAAVGVLTEESLPPRSTPGVLEAMGQGSLVPSRALEHAKWLAGTAGDLESTLRAIDGVLSARVHLAAPAQNALDLNQDRPAPTASVLLRHRGATPPIAPGDVQLLVAGAVSGLDPKAVSVVSSAAPPRSKRDGRLLAQLGPITVTQASLLPLKAIFGTVIALNLILLGLFAWQWMRARRVQEKLSDLEGSDASASAS